MTDRPILFSGPMVRAILDGQKTQTRRAVKLAGPDVVEERDDGSRWPYCVTWAHGDDGSPWYACPYGEPGDRLWVRETWSTATGNGHRTVYRADLGTDRWPTPVEAPAGRVWRPSIHMKRAASRLTLEVTSVSVERLHDITEDDARAEGVDWSRPEPYGEKWDDDREDPREVGYPPAGASFARDNFRRLWSSINGPESWAANPWVWVVGFRRV